MSEVVAETKSIGELSGCHIDRRRVGWPMTTRRIAPACYTRIVLARADNEMHWCASVAIQRDAGSEKAERGSTWLAYASDDSIRMARERRTTCLVDEYDSSALFRTQ